MAVGLSTLIQGGLYLSGRTDGITGGWIGAVVGLAAGGALLVGLLTPIVALLTGLTVLGIGFSLLPAPAPNMFDAKLPVVLIAIVTAAIAFLGPGAFSLDAHLFGRREIIIPRRPEK